MSRRRAALAVAGGYLAVTLLYAATVSPTWRDAVPSWRGGFDVPLQAFLIGWGWHALRHDPSNVMNAPIFYPEPRTLTYMDSLIGETVTGVPVLAATGSVAAAYNALVALAFFLSAAFTYRLARAAGAGRAGSFLGGLLFAASSYRLTNGDLLNQVQTQFIPLGLLFALRFRETRSLEHGAGLIATLVVQSYFGWYGTFILLTALLLLALHALLDSAVRPSRGTLAKVAVIAVASGILILPLALPYVVQRLAMPEFRRTLGQAALYSADVLDYLTASDLAPAWGSPFLPKGVDALFPGFLCLLLAVIGFHAIRSRTREADGSARRGIRRRILDALAWSGTRGSLCFLAAASLVLSLGPILHVGGHTLPILLPYCLAFFLVPGLASLRAPLRFGVMVFVALAVVAAIGYDVVDRWARQRGRGVAALLFIVCAFVAVGSTWPAAPRAVLLPTDATLDPAYRWLRERRVKEPLLEFPTPARDEDETMAQALRQYSVLLHGTPRLDGCSGFVSARYKAFRRDIQTFPDSSATALAASMGARWVLIHFADYPDSVREGFRGRLESSRALRRVATFGPDVLYRLESREQAEPGISTGPSRPLTEHSPG